MESYVYVEGTIESLSVREDFAFLNLKDDTDSIPVVIFDSLDFELKLGDAIGIAGEVSLYKGDEEIIADEILCIVCGGYYLELMCALRLLILFISSINALSGDYLEPV